jgi:2-oxo-4-hydroxy-4-carboxy-5-ureidoimidazoline decarboxylase
MNKVLAAWNEAPEPAAVEAMLACCAAQRWARAMVALRPCDSIDHLRGNADHAWSTMQEPDWLEAFAAHPRIGAHNPPSHDKSSAWSRQEQSSIAETEPEILARLFTANKSYEKRFGFTYIVCATGKTAEEMLLILERRLANSRETELHEAAEQQRLIMHIRLTKWLSE